MSLASMIEAVEMFDELLMEENELLRRQDAPGVAQLQERKQAMSRLYQERLRTVLKSGDTGQELSPGQRALALALARKMEERAAENAVLLRAVMQSIERVFAAINTAVKKKAAREVNYSREGLVLGAIPPSRASVAYNSTV